MQQLAVWPAQANINFRVCGVASWEPSRSSHFKSKVWKNLGSNRLEGKEDEPDVSVSRVKSHVLW